MVAALIAAATIVAGEARGDEIRRWRDAEGKLHYSISGSPASSAESEAAPRIRGREPSEPERFSVSASLRRRELERDLRAASDDLRAIREEARATREKSLTVRSPRTAQSPADVQLLLDAQRDAFLAVRAFEQDRDETLRRLGRRERARLHDILATWAEFETLRQKVVETYGEAPPWWRDQLECEHCPSADEAATALAEAEDADTDGGARSDAAERKPEPRAPVARGGSAPEAGGEPAADDEGG